jgi:hypothetical protein
MKEEPLARIHVRKKVMALGVRGISHGLACFWAKSGEFSLTLQMQALGSFVKGIHDRQRRDHSASNSGGSGGDPIVIISAVHNGVEFNYGYTQKFAAVRAGRKRHRQHAEASFA